MLQRLRTVETVRWFGSIETVLNTVETAKVVDYCRMCIGIVVKTVRLSSSVGR